MSALNDTLQAVGERVRQFAQAIVEHFTPTPSPLSPNSRRSTSSSPQHGDDGGDDGEEIALERLVACIIQDNAKDLEQKLNLLRGRSIIDFKFERSQRSLLHIAASMGACNCLSLLVLRGLNVNEQDLSGITPTMLASRNGHKKCLKMLLSDFKADPGIIDNQGYTAIHWLASNGRTELLQFLLDAGQPVDIKDHTGMTPLHTACQSGHSPVVSFLLEKKANGRALDNTGQSPLYLACKFGQTDCARLLLDASCPLTPISGGQDGFDASVIGGHSSCLALLIDYHPVLLQRFIQLVCSNTHTQAHVQPMVNHLCKSSPALARLILLNVAKNALLIGQELLCLTSDLEGTSQRFLRVVCVLSTAFEQGVEKKEKVYSHIVGEAVGALEPLWTALRDWMLLVKESIPDDHPLMVAALKRHPPHAQHGEDSLIAAQSKAMSSPLPSPPLKSKHTSLLEERTSDHSEKNNTVNTLVPEPPHAKTHDEMVDTSKNDKNNNNNNMPSPPILQMAQPLDQPTVIPPLHLDLANNNSSVNSEDNSTPSLPSTSQNPLITPQLEENPPLPTSSSVSASPSDQAERPHVAEDAFLGLFNLYRDRLCTVINGYYTMSKAAGFYAELSDFDGFVKANTNEMRMFVAHEPEIIFSHFSFFLDREALIKDFLDIIQNQPFSRRREWFYSHLRSGIPGGNARASLNAPVFTFQRDRVFESSCEILLSQEADALKREFGVQFDGEAAMGNGVKREWFTLLSREVINPDYGLFVATPEGTYQPNYSSSINPDHLSYFKLAGSLVGLALYHGQLIDVYFARAFYKHLLHVPCGLADMKSADPVYAKSLAFLLENDISALDLELTFCAEVDVFGVTSRVDLVPDGAAVAVMEGNKERYVDLLCDFKLTRAIAPQIGAFLDGFHQFIPRTIISIFDEYELELLLSGVPQIDTKDWSENTTYTGYEPTDDVIVWFWELVSSFDQHCRALLLQFATGSSRVPIGGFSNLTGSSGPQKFCISRSPTSAELLPTASTCFNLLKLPCYPSKGDLQKALLTVLKHGGVGFEFA